MGEERTGLGGLDADCAKEIAVMLSNKQRSRPGVTLMTDDLCYADKETTRPGLGDGVRGVWKG